MYNINEKINVEKSIGVKLGPEQKKRGKYEKHIDVYMHQHIYVYSIYDLSGI